MKIAIAGAGTTAAYAFRLLKQRGMQADIYDRVIDATGISRSYLPPIKGDVLLPCIQRRIETGEPLENRIKLGGVGYAWIFPLSRFVYHIGCGSLAGVFRSKHHLHKHPVVLDRLIS